MYKNSILDELDELIKSEKTAEYKLPLRCGVDLGTANIVIAVVDADGKPVAGIVNESKVVKDGIVVDYVGAIQNLKKMKVELEERLGTELINAATAIPPGILVKNAKGFVSVVEGAGFEVTNIVDEPTAAATVIGIKDGAVVDIGGGTTGISVLENGEVIFTADEPTGGTHMTLAVAGYYGVDKAEAEKMKKDRSHQSDIYSIVVPVVEKMSTIVKGFLKDHPTDTVYVVGGASLFDDFEETFNKVTGVECIKAEKALLVTPYGIALNCK